MTGIVGPGASLPVGGGLPNPAPLVRASTTLGAPATRSGAAAGVLLLISLLGPAVPAPACSSEGAAPGVSPAPSLGLVFSGGGAKGAYEAGLALALRERGVVPAVVAGTSSGAITAVMVAAGDEERLAGIWRTIRRDDIFAYRAPLALGGLLPGWLALPILLRARGLLDPAPLRATLTRHVDFGRVRVSPTRVLVVATDLRSGAPHRFDNATVSVDALMASAAVPGLFPPVEVDGALLVDGGVVQRAPTLELLDAHPVQRVLVVLGYESEAPAEATVQAVLERALELALVREILRDVELARFRHPSVDLRVLRPSVPLRVRPLDFDGTRLSAIVDLGRADGRRCLDVLGYR